MFLYIPMNGIFNQMEELELPWRAWTATQKSKYSEAISRNVICHKTATFSA